MKKIVLLLLLLSASGHSQEFGITKIDVEKKKSDYKPATDYEMWVDFDNSYIMTFKQNPVGIRKAITTIKRILEANGLSFEKPDVDEVYLSSAVDDINDSEILDITIRQGSSEVKKIWQLNGKIISIGLTEKAYFITIKK